MHGGKLLCFHSLSQSVIILSYGFTCSAMDQMYGAMWTEVEFLLSCNLCPCDTITHKFIRCIIKYVNASLYAKRTFNIRIEFMSLSIKITIWFISIGMTDQMIFMANTFRHKHIDTVGICLMNFRWKYIYMPPFILQGIPCLGNDRNVFNIDIRID